MSLMYIKDGKGDWYNLQNIKLFFVSGSSIYFEVSDLQSSKKLESFESPFEAAEKLQLLLKTIGKVVSFKKIEGEEANGIMVAVE